MTMFVNDKKFVAFKITAILSKSIKVTLLSDQYSRKTLSGLKWNTPCWVFSRVKNIMYGKIIKIREFYPSQILKHYSKLNLNPLLSLVKWNFSRMNPYWICEHLKLIKNKQKSFLEKVETFPHKSLLDFWASEVNQNWT